MEVVELHFFHGFLGSVKDWAPVKEFFLEQKRIKMICHDLREDFISMGKKNSIDKWACYKANQIQGSSYKKFLVGYSLGGRLLLHIDPTCYWKMLLIGVHPGLEREKEQRLESDKKWQQKLWNQGSQQWLQDWNNQDVFKQDCKRPTRDYSKVELEIQMEMLVSWSLGKQNLRDEYLLEHGEKIYWLCGGLDTKFLALKERLSKLLPKEHISTVAGAGHGVLFDKPRAIAEQIKRIV